MRPIAWIHVAPPWSGRCKGKTCQVSQAGKGREKGDVVMDAKSVWSAVGNDKPECTDQLVLLHLCKLREVVRDFVDQFHWVDTRSMLSDSHST